MNKYRFILKYILLFFLYLICSLIVYSPDLDEIWCYGFSHNMYSGLIPYKDFNMVITPLYPFTVSISFYIFGSSMLVFHVVNSLFFVIISYFMFDLIKEKAWFVLLFFFVPISWTSLGYNLLLLLFLILIIWLEKKEKNDYLIGFILALTVLTKQSVGVCLLFPSLFYFKQPKKILKRILGFLIPITFFIIYLLLTNSYMQFLDLCLFGLFDFASYNTNVFTIGFVLTIILLFFTLIFIKNNSKNISNYYVLFFYSICIPLFDLNHFLPIFIVFLFLCFYEFEFCLYLKPKLFFILILLIISVIIINNRMDGKILYPNNINHFEFMLYNYAQIKIIEDVNKLLDKYDNYRFVFLDKNGYYFKLINDIPIDYYDLINYGNWGYNGSDKLLMEIKELDDTIFFVDPDELKRGTQTDKEVIKYILENGKKIDSIYMYDIYTL